MYPQDITEFERILTHGGQIKHGCEILACDGWASRIYAWQIRSKNGEKGIKFSRI
jgi:hypothetical protein